MNKSLEDIEAMLRELPDSDTDWRFDVVTEDALTYTGALRTSNGRNVIEPAMEAQSMIVGLKPSVEFLREAPRIVRQLLDMVKGDKDATPSEKEESA